MPILRLLLFSLLAMTSLQSQARPLKFAELPLESTEIYLLEANRGPAIYMIGGHLLVGIRNEELGIDLVINWGLFDFDAPNFFTNYVLGIWTYGTGISRPERVIYMYEHMENRSVWQYSLHLTSLQKKRLLAKADWWLQPENRNYRYDLWYYNCSTIVRDLLADALGSGFRDYYEVPAGKTMRDVGLPFYKNYMALAFLSPFFTNSDADYEIKHWDEFLLPVLAPKLLAKIPSFDDNGGPNDEKLLGKKIQLVQGETLYAPSFPYASLAFWALALLPLLALLAALCRCVTLAQRLTAAGLALWAISSTVLSLLMLAVWGFTYHSYMAHNVNLWFCWPTDFLILPLLLRPSPKRLLLLSRYTMLHGACAVLALLLWQTGWLLQDISVTLYYWLPATCLALGGYFLLRRKTLTSGLGKIKP